MSTTPPANTEFLTVKLELMTAERDKLQLELGDLRVLRAARPAPPPADHIGDATKLVGERAALINRLRQSGYPLNLAAADMLAADANDAFAPGMACRPASAQQVVVPHGWRPAPVDPTPTMCAAGFVVSEAEHDPAGVYRAMLAATPKPPQADALAADHAEDVRAMVPMTEKELDDLLPTNDSMSRKDSQRWIARATERHHKIGVKQ